MSDHVYGQESPACLNCGGELFIDTALGRCPGPRTTQPPGPEAVGTAEFERRVEEQGEQDARLGNVARQLPRKTTEFNGSANKGAVELLNAFFSVGPNAQKILLDIASRLEKGAVQYGDFDGPNADRDWDQETYEEHLDALVYQAVKRLRSK